MPDLQRDDISLHFEVTGSGPALILLAGMFSDSSTWTPVLPLLEPHFTVIRPDNRSTGRTTPWNANISVMKMAEDALALLDHLEHDRFHVAGHSMGGLMGMELSALAKDRALSLSILASGQIRVPLTNAVFDALLRIRRAPEGEEVWLRALYPWLFRPAFFTKPDHVEVAIKAATEYPYGQTVDAMEHQMHALATFKPKTRAPDVTCPTQVVFAEKDLLIPEQDARQAFSSNPAIEMSTIPDAGHSIFWDAPDAVSQKILAFTARA